jgi:glucokinase
MSDFKDWSGKSIGLELSAGRISAVAISPEGAVLDSAIREIEHGANSFERLTEVIRGIANASPGVQTVGLALPGLIDRSAGRIAHSTLNTLMQGTGISDAIKSETGVSVVIENDANAAAICELRVGAGRGCRNMFYITLGEGVGGAIILNGELWRGDSGFAGEFGSVAINSDGMRLEDIASAANIVRRTQNRFHQDSTSSLSRLPEESINIDAIVNAARAEDDFALLMLERTGTYVGTAVASVINLLDIERIVVGGDIMRAGSVVMDAIIERAQELAFAPAFKKTTIVAGEIERFAAPIGVALTII